MIYIEYHFILGGEIVIIFLLKNMAMYDKLRRGYRVFIGDIGNDISIFDLDNELKFLGLDNLRDMWIIR